MHDKCIGLFTNPTKPEILDKVKSACQALTDAGYRCSVHASMSDAFPLAATYEAQRPDCIVAFGGDGTILRASKESVCYDAPILGVNLGRVGFLSEVPIDGLCAALDRYIRGEYELDEHMMLTYSINGIDAYDCLNDILLYKKTFSGVAEICVNVGGVDAGKVFCDGLIISTPTGATGYSISAGGPVIADGLNAAIITPICPHTLCFRPIIAAADTVLTFSLPSGGLVAADGMFISEVSAADVITVRKSEKRVLFIRMSDRNLYKLIKNRLA